MLLSGPSPPVKIRKTTHKPNKSDPVAWGSRSVGHDLQQLAKERNIHTDPGETRRRRTLRLVRPDRTRCWGFTLQFVDLFQTYGIRHKRTGELELMTYVDYVELGSAACIAGMRKGDVLLSVNGESVEGLTHGQLVSKIQQCHDVLRLVVLFEDCCRKVELYERFIKLKRVLASKKRELAHLEHQEKVLRSGGLLSPFGFSRDSVRSSTSSDWDRYSALGYPAVLGSAPPSPATPRSSALESSIPSPSGQQPRPSSYPSNTLTLPAARARPQSASESGLIRSLERSSAQASAGHTSDVDKVVTDSMAGTTGGTHGEEPEYSDASHTTGRWRNKDEEAEEEAEEPSSGTSSQEESSDSDAGPPPVCRMRSNSVILNEMRLKLLVDIVCHEASTAAGLLEFNGIEEEEDDDDEDPCMDTDSPLGELSDSEVVVEVEEDEDEVMGEGKNRENGGMEKDDDFTEEESEREEKKTTRKRGKENREQEDQKNTEEVAMQEKTSIRLCRGVRVNDDDEVTKL